ncbi:hypothetical protein [Maricaulis sp.]|uniref:hypothetical protein n=1 Tax=Maricaulis sp. TaxID=1486257 RepID=UPI00260E2E4D|nr:hypothetical protein [Maricaulis sp.]
MKHLLLAGAVAALTACNAAPPPAEQTEAAAAHSDMETLPREKRVAFMSGHVMAGLALYRAGAPEEAAPHLLHPVSETHAAERAGLDELGFDPAIFEAVSTALAAGRPANEVERLLNGAQANLARMQNQAGGDPMEIISYLMDVLEEEYAIGVTDGVITDPGEYQDAFGFTQVALRLARRAENEPLAAELEALQAMWPESGPLAASTPTPVADVNAQIARVRAQIG